MAYIEHCCCERQLPALLREQSTAFFQTSGDVTIAQMMKSVGCMVSNGCTMWLMTESVGTSLMRVIRHWFERGWLARLWLLTKEDCSEAVRAELAAVVQQKTEPADGAATELQQTGQEVLYGCDKSAGGGLLAFSDGEKTVVIVGEMLQEKAAGMRMYSCCFGAAEGKNVRGAMDAAAALMRARCKAVTDSDTSAAAEQGGDTSVGKPPSTLPAAAEQSSSVKAKRNRRRH